MIKSAFRPDTEEIHLLCPDCETKVLLVVGGKPEKVQ
jgi:hypothetical protein